MLRVSSIALNKLCLHLLSAAYTIYRLTMCSITVPQCPFSILFSDSPQKENTRQSKFAPSPSDCILRTVFCQLYTSISLSATSSFWQQTSTVELGVLYKLSRIKSSRRGRSKVMALVCRTSTDNSRNLRGGGFGGHTIWVLSVYCVCMKNRRTHI